MKKNTYILLALLILAFSFWTYRINDLLGFYFDQGRDAKVIWDFWHNGKLFLIGPTTGIAGIFRGPFYYLLIAPFYLLGGGNPIYPSMFLSLLSVFALFLMYKIATKIIDEQAGLIAVFIATFSLNIMLAARWLSNPTPMLILSMMLVFFVFWAIDGKKYAWPVVAFIVGTSLFHFGSAGEFFYIFALVIISLLNWKNFPKDKYFIISVVAFLLTALPQIAFDIRHDGILSNNIKKFLVDDQSFKISFWEVFKLRINFIYDVYTNKIFHWRRNYEFFLMGFAVIIFVKNLKFFLTNKKSQVVLIFLIAPLIGLTFFQGNEGNVYDYYLTGYYLIFVLFVGLILRKAFDLGIIGKIFVFLFLLNVVSNNLPFIRYKLRDGVDGPQTIGFKNQKQAIDWIYEDADGAQFSIDVYVPPVIPHAYDYLFIWYGGSVKGYNPLGKVTNPMYTLYEVDPPFPYRLENWLMHQDTVGKVLYEESFGGITVQKRLRY